MTRKSSPLGSILAELRSRLPRTIGLGRHIPERREFCFDAFDPANVDSVSDLPPYLILGELDVASCHFSSTGWAARWQGRDCDTHFDVTYKRKEHRFEIRQIWCGLDGGFSTYPASVPLPKLIGMTLYMEFPEIWDTKAKEVFENRYQLTYISHQPDCASPCFIPDGAFKTIAFPIGAYSLKSVFDRLLSISDSHDLTYPFNAYSCPLFQAVNYLEGRAPDWTSEPDKVIKNSLLETGFVPLEPPVREKASDGTAAWTLRRETYVVFIGVPFAGLTDILERLCSPEGPIRYRSDAALQFEMQPVIFASGIEVTSESIFFWNREGTTRCFWAFRRDGETLNAGQMVQAAQQSQAISSSLITDVENISLLQIKSVSDVLKT